MPTISRFCGITITMHWDEPHHSARHFHALYGEYEAALTLAGEVIAGDLLRPQLRLVQAWCELYPEELRTDWLCAAEGQPLEPIAPLR